MLLTRIEKENRDYFTHICPEVILDNEETVRFGVINDEGYAVAACAVAIQENMAVIYWIMTDEDFREQGAASFLLEEVEDLIKDMKLTGMEIRFESEDEDLDDFLTDRGFLVGEDSQVYSVPMEELIYSREMDVILETSGEDNKVFSIPDSEGKKQNLIDKICGEHALEKNIFDGISSTYSYVYSEDGSKITGVLAVSEYGDEDLFVNYLVSKGSVNCIRSLIRALYTAVTETGMTAGNLRFTGRNESAISLIERFTGTDRDEFKVSGHYYAVKLFV